MSAHTPAWLAGALDGVIVREESGDRPLTHREVRSIYRGDLPRPAIKALCGAWQVTIADTRYGRNDLLWPLLAQWATGTTNPNTRPEGSHPR